MINDEQIVGYVAEIRPSDQPEPTWTLSEDLAPVKDTKTPAVPSVRAVPITQYQSKNGAIFKTREEALDDSLGSDINELAEQNGDSWISQDVIDFIVNNIHDLRRLINAYYEEL